MKIVITDWAKANLKDIHNYHKNVASLRTANSIKNKIIAGIKDIPNFINKYQEEENLKKLALGHRRYITGNYKIVYRVEKKTIFITDIFDSRQDPKKMNG
ncbi:MAG: type II toxin-antitoxin system RelE/ParE family toxin [Flavobacteriales bacterium]